MTLVDAGPLIALLRRRDEHHLRCTAAIKRLSAPLVTTWPAFTEAMYRLGQVSGWPAQDLLWGQAVRGELLLAELAPDAQRRSRALMQRYAGLPMDLADATLVALAEERGFRRIFTLDSDFYVYRLANGRQMDVVP